MSNGIYLLQTKEGFRVSYYDHYDEFFGNFRDETIQFDLIPQIVKEVFGKSEVFTSEQQALQAAFDISKVIEETDDGIVFIGKYTDYTFEELTSGKTT